MRQADDDGDVAAVNDATHPFFFELVVAVVGRGQDRVAVRQPLDPAERQRSHDAENDEKQQLKEV